MATRQIKDTWRVDFWWTHQQGQMTGMRERIRRKSPINTKRDAEAYERLLRRHLTDGKSLDGSDPNARRVPTFAEWFENFFGNYVTANNRPSVHKEKREIADQHLIPVFGSMLLDKIGHQEIEVFKVALLTKPRSQQDARTLSAKRVKNILAVLSKCLRWAEDVGVISKAPKIVMPKIPPSTVNSLAADAEARLTTMASTDSQTHAMFVIGLYAGLRRGEIIGLEWDDINFAAKTITVRRSVWFRSANEPIVGPPKSGRDRVIPMSMQLYAALHSLRHLRGKLVFSNPDGKVLTPGQLSATMLAARTRAGISKSGWHTLRHTFASKIVQRGGSPKVVQEVLGHSDISTTMRYLHVAPAHHREAIALLDQPPQALVG